MEEFAIAQIEEGHIDDNLAIIYSDLLNKGMIQKRDGRTTGEDSLYP